MREEHLEAFVAAARDGTFAKAARALSRSPSTVRRQITALENELGVRLLVRRGDGVQVTAAGKSYRPHAVEILQALNDARSAAAASD